MTAIPSKASGHAFCEPGLRKTLAFILCLAAGIVIVADRAWAQEITPLDDPNLDPPMADPVPGSSRKISPAVATEGTAAVAPARGDTKVSANRTPGRKPQSPTVPAPQVRHGAAG